MNDKSSKCIEREKECSDFVDDNRESFTTHTGAFALLSEAIGTFISIYKDKQPELGDDIDFIVWTIGLLQEFYQDENVYIQKLTAFQKRFANNCLIIFKQLIQLRESVVVENCTYEKINAWNNDRRENAHKLMTFPHKVCFKVANTLDRYADTEKCVNSTIRESDIRSLMETLAILSVSDGFWNAFKQFVVDFDSFIAKNAVTSSIAKEKSTPDKATLELMQEMLGFLHSHANLEEAKAEEEQIIIFLEEHEANVIWPGKDDMRTNDHFFVSYDSNLSEAKDIRPCIVCDKITLRGARILPSAD